MNTNFKPGDRVEFCGEEAVVVMNYGSQGVVEIPGTGKCVWHWMFQGTPVTLVKAAPRKRVRPED